MELEAAFTKALYQLVHNGATGTLRDLLDLALAALIEVRLQRIFTEPEPELHIIQ